MLLSDFSARRPRAVWAEDFKALCTALFKKLGTDPESKSGQRLAPGPGVINFNTLMCQGCCIVSARTWEHAPGKTELLNNIPKKSEGPHDAMCAVYLICMQIANLVADRALQGTTESRAWRLDGLIHLYVGYLIYIAGKRDVLPFHGWYMYVFHSLRSYEQEQDHGRYTPSPIVSLCLKWMQVRGALVRISF